MYDMIFIPIPPKEVDKKLIDLLDRPEKKSAMRWHISNSYPLSTREIGELRKASTRFLDDRNNNPFETGELQLKATAAGDIIIIHPASGQRAELKYEIYGTSRASLINSYLEDLFKALGRGTIALLYVLYEGELTIQQLDTILEIYQTNSEQKIRSLISGAK